MSPLLSDIYLWKQQLYHPNFDFQGNICLNILREDWRPVLSIGSVLQGLLFLFLHPNPDDPLNIGMLHSRYRTVTKKLTIQSNLRITEVADTMQQNPREFETNVKNSLRGGTVSMKSGPRRFPKLLA